MENKNFRKIITLIESHPHFYNTLRQIEQDYMVKIYKVSELNTHSVTELYGNMQKKFYINRKKQNQEFWYENQLRIFIWLLFAYLFLHQKSIPQLNEADWNFFSSIFNCKSTVFFEFQALSVLKNKERPPSWTEEEANILQQIMSYAKFQNRWNSIARELFIKSGRRFFRNPKQCRERWMNHLDPSKIRTSWTLSEDLTLLNTIKKKGKKWSLAVKELSNTRTEHMVKNRYKSLIANEAKKYPEKRQSELENILIKRISKAHLKASKNMEVKVEQREQSRSVEGDVQAKNSEVQEQMVEEPQIKVEQDQSQHHIEYGSLNEQLRSKSPIYLPWSEGILNCNIVNLLEDRVDLQNNNFYEFHSQDSFLF